MTKVNAASTQEHLPIAGIQDDVIIMNDGSLRAVLKVEPINFDLKSEVEQNGIIYSYQGFLNSLEFPIQILVQSKKLDLEHYLTNLEDLKKDMSNDLLRIQTEDYVDFVRRLISVANIMSKRFFIIVSYSFVSAKPTGLNALFSRKPTGPILEQDQFERMKTEVFNRANVIAGGLGRIGLRCTIQSTQQLIEMFYTAYNPDIATEERISETDNLSAGVVSSFISPTPATPDPEPTPVDASNSNPVVLDDFIAPAPENPTPSPTEPEEIDLTNQPTQNPPA